MVRLNAVLLAGGERITLRPAPVVRCRFAESSPAGCATKRRRERSKLGAALRAVETYDDFECRGRNRVAGAKLSEHGKGNAVDLRALMLADGRAIGLTDVTVPKEFRDDLRESACHRFTTVLGPGSDGYHESHIHLDLPSAVKVTVCANGMCANRRPPKSPPGFHCRCHGRRYRTRP